MDIVEYLIMLFQLGNDTHLLKELLNLSIEYENLELTAWLQNNFFKSEIDMH